MGAVLILLLGLLAAATATVPLGRKCGSVPNGDVIPDMNYCANYMICTNGILMAFSCPENYKFNANNALCEYNAECWTGNKDGGSGTDDGQFNPCKQKTTGTYVPDPLSCQSFYYCFQGNSLSATCPTGYAFSNLHSSCVPSDKNNCS